MVSINSTYAYVCMYVCEHCTCVYIYVEVHTGVYVCVHARKYFHNVFLEVFEYLFKMSKMCSHIDSEHFNFFFLTKFHKANPKPLHYTTKFFLKIFEIFQILSSDFHIIVQIWNFKTLLKIHI